jgi:hypothetical protein
VDLHCGMGTLGSHEYPHPSHAPQGQLAQKPVEFCRVGYMIHSGYVSSASPSTGPAFFDVVISGASLLLLVLINPHVAGLMRQLYHGYHGLGRCMPNGRRYVASVLSPPSRLSTQTLTHVHKGIIYVIVGAATLTM